MQNTQREGDIMVYFIADTHFSEENIILYENRPFKTVQEMDREIVMRWNNTVKYNDIVYVLGDFGATGNEKAVLSHLNGGKFLIKGNHDTNSNTYYREAGFKEVSGLPVILDSFWILSHEPLYVNKNMPYANIFGHVHNSPVFKTYSSQHYCVSVERTDYTPLAFEEIISKVKGNL